MKIKELFKKRISPSTKLPMPVWDDIPMDDGFTIYDNYTKPPNRWINIVETIFYKDGFIRVVAKRGINPDEAMKCCRRLLGDFCKHERKIAGVAWLMSLWFEDVEIDGKLII